LSAIFSFGSPTSQFKKLLTMVIWMLNVPIDLLEGTDLYNVQISVFALHN